MGTLTKSWDKNPPHVCPRPNPTISSYSENGELLKKENDCTFRIYVLVFIHEIISDYCARVARVLLNAPANALEKKNLHPSINWQTFWELLSFFWVILTRQ